MQRADAIGVFPGTSAEIPVFRSGRGILEQSPAESDGTMQELKFVRVEDGALVVTDDGIEFYRVPVDDAVLSGIRQIARHEHGSKASPKEIQALLRAGKTPDEVCELSGASSEDVERFGAPVFAEREFILENALRVSVVNASAAQHPETTTFGAAMSERLEGLKATKVTWAAWRDEHHGWMVALSFRSRDVDHYAEWTFDHRRNVLSPANADATSLSKQGDVGDRLIPKLRAVETEKAKDRFDSDAFNSALMPVDSPSTQPHDTVSIDPASLEDFDEERERRQHIEERAVAKEEESVDFGQTADLLDALRRRRGQRDSQPQPVIEQRVDRDTDSLQEREPAVKIESNGDVTGSEAAAQTNDSGRTGLKRGRQEMPSWDDILFGTRSDEDPF